MKRKGGLCGWLACTSAGVVVAEKQTKTRFNRRGKLFTLVFLGKGEYCRPGGTKVLVT